jgi:cytochrome c oxidase subunit I+III
MGGAAISSGIDGGFTVTPTDPEPLAETPPEQVRRGQEERLLRAWKLAEGWRYWSNVNNSEVGKWYTATAIGFLLFGGILGC